ncbi:MAG: oligopeptide/dipeptide ABC transporter ATP-binding protein [Planctomycetota bacterium]
MALIETKGLTKHFPIRGGFLNRVTGHVQAVNGVSLSIASGETLGVVGESGCGKSTLGKTIVRLHDATDGVIAYEGDDISGLSHEAMLPYRRKIQMIFQDPYSSLNPRMTVGGHLKDAVRLHGVVEASEEAGYIAELLSTVGLRPEAAERYPHEFSGGQRQRIGIARALAVKPQFIVADEPVSALDVSVQAQVLNLMTDLRERFGLTMLFISHDLKVVEHFCDRIAVMYLGFVVEEIDAGDVEHKSEHPYTRALLGANPPDAPPEREEDRIPLTVLEGDVPSPVRLPRGCAFAGRCPKVMERCRVERPGLEMKQSGHRIACFAVE